jgi:hypothetical protein
VCGPVSVEPYRYRYLKKMDSAQYIRVRSNFDFSATKGMLARTSCPASVANRMVREFPTQSESMWRNESLLDLIQPNDKRDQNNTEVPKQGLISWSGSP